MVCWFCKCKGTRKDVFLHMWQDHREAMTGKAKPLVKPLTLSNQEEVLQRIVRDVVHDELNDLTEPKVQFFDMQSGRLHDLAEAIPKQNVAETAPALSDPYRNERESHLGEIHFQRDLIHDLISRICAEKEATR